MGTDLAEGETTGDEECGRGVEPCAWAYRGGRRCWCEKAKSAHFIELSEWAIKTMVWQGRRNVIQHKTS